MVSSKNNIKPPMNHSMITENTSQKKMKKRPPKNVSMKKIIEAG